MTAKKPAKSAAWLPPGWDIADAHAIQRLASGEATPDQQKRALRYVVETLCATYDLPYRPESARDTDFALGRMFVGQQIVKLTKINLSTLKEKTQ
jgi:hypothetical protein